MACVGNLEESVEGYLELSFIMTEVDNLDISLGGIF